MHDVVVTGIGVVLPNCHARATFWQQLRDGDSQLGLEPNPARPDDVRAIGRIADFEPGEALAEIPERFWGGYPRELQLYLASVFRARDDARVSLARTRSDRVGLFDGCARPTFDFWYDRFKLEAERPPREVYNRRDLAIGLPGNSVGFAAALLQIRGPAYAFSGTCSSGAIAVGHAWREIRDGELDLAFASGHETSLLPPLYAMYGDANLLSDERQDPRRAVRAFAGHSTNAFGEGAVTLVLESRAHAEARGARPIAAIGGYRYGNNGYHPTTVDINGARPAEVIGALLQKSGVAPSEIGFVVGHGNGVEVSDVSEDRYMTHVFGERAATVPLLSTKAIWGHTLGASSAINVAAAALMLDKGFEVPADKVLTNFAQVGNVSSAAIPLALEQFLADGTIRPGQLVLSPSTGTGWYAAALLYRV